MIRALRSIRNISLFAAIVAQIACSSAPLQLGGAESGAIDVSRARPISSERCGFQLLLFIPIAINDRFEKVYADLRNQAGADLIGDVEVRESWRYAFVGTLYCTELVAKAYPRT